MDILERLRTIPRSGLPIGHTWNLCDDAADEIEKLRVALQWLVNDLQNHPMSGGLLVAFDNARAALGEKE